MIDESLFNSDDPQDQEILDLIHGLVKIRYDHNDLDYILLVSQRLISSGLDLIHYTQSIFTLQYQSNDLSLPLPTKADLKALTLVQV